MSDDVGMNLDDDGRMTKIMESAAAAGKIIQLSLVSHVSVSILIAKMQSHTIPLRYTYTI